MGLLSRLKWATLPSVIWGALRVISTLADKPSGSRSITAPPFLVQGPAGAPPHALERSPGGARWAARSAGGPPGVQHRPPGQQGRGRRAVRKMVPGRLGRGVFQHFSIHVNRAKICPEGEGERLEQASVLFLTHSHAGVGRPFAQRSNPGRIHRFDFWYVERS